MYHVNFHATDDQEKHLRWLKEYSGLTISEFSRRLYDYAFQEKVLNELIPSMSGRLQLGGK